ncbi:NYN domain-containing protein [bacterium]|nr:NYN domain-containing protein [bacterium]
MPFLIDGDNLLGTSGQRRTDAAKRKLAFDLARWAQEQGRRVTVVFDGPEPGAPAFGASVRFSGGGRTADDLILSMLRKQPDARGWIVVTSDRSLGDQCRWIGAARERCDVFRKRLTHSRRHEKPEREDEIEYWLEQFGAGPED